MSVSLKILVRTPNWIGDHVMAQPFYESLNRAYPDSEIHLLCSEALQSFKEDNFCKKKIVLIKNAKNVGREFFTLAKKLKKEKYDIAISLTSSFSSSLLLSVARIPIRLGFSQSGSGLFLTDSLKWKGIDSGKHKTEIYLELLDFMTGSHWKFKSYEETFVTAKKRIILAPGASISLRVWPYFQELLGKLSQEYPEYEIGVVGSKQESQWHSIIESLNLRNVKNWVEKTTLPELIELCRESSLVIANDSGVAHLSGTMAQAPTLVLLGPGCSNYIRPLGRRVFCEIPVGVPCHPCEKPYCHEKYGYQACLKSISLDRVLSKVFGLVPK